MHGRRIAARSKQATLNGRMSYWLLGASAATWAYAGSGTAILICAILLIARGDTTSGASELDSNQIAVTVH